MAISLTCECGKKLAVKEELAGKKVKCPACESLLTVPSLSDEKPARKRPAEVDDDEEDEDRDQEEVRPRKKKKKKRAAKSNKLTWIGAGVGVLLLGFCCVGLVGGGGWWFFLRSGPEKTIIGRWGFDVESTKKNNPIGWEQMFPKGTPPQMIRLAEQELAKSVIEIKADGNLIVSKGGLGTETSKWKNATSKGDTVTIEIKQDGPFNQSWEKIEFKVIDSNHLQFTPKGVAIGGSMWLKRL
jgi:hypothetical protein